MFYGQGKLWQERFYHGVVREVEDSVVREWAGEEFVQAQPHTNNECEPIFFAHVQKGQTFRFI